MKKYSGLNLLIFSLFAIIIITANSCNKDDDTPPATIITVDNDGNTTINNSLLATKVNALPKEPLSDDEKESILFMREEEMMARDFNIISYQKWGQLTFDNISKAEQTHMNATLLLINKYALTDPVGLNPIGVFTNTTLKGLYAKLINQSNISLIEALKAGAAIEEIDIQDINSLLDKDDINNSDIELVYSNLLKGSRNHLRSFVKVLDQKGVTYVPEYISQTLYDSIINSPMETGY